MNSSKPADHNTLFYRLGLLSRRWRQTLDQVFQSVGLTDATWRPLLHLHLLGGGVRQKELAASIGIEGPTLVRLIDTLAAKGLIIRSEDRQDRRARQISLTAEGLLVVEQIMEVVSLLQKELLAPFHEQQIRQFEQFIEELETAVSRVRERVKR